jgi:hypothetical protein
MRMTVKAVVRGATRFDNKIDGELVQSATIFTDVSLDKNGEGWGSRTEPMPCASLDVVDKIKATPFPFEAELEIEQRATKKATRLVVIDCKPLSRVKQAA